MFLFHYIICLFMNRLNSRIDLIDFPKYILKYLYTTIITALYISISSLFTIVCKFKFIKLSVLKSIRCYMKKKTRQKNNNRKKPVTFPFIK